MRIFVSYSSKDRDVAEQLAVALLAEHHKVFFDQKSLGRGEAYNKAIRREIERADLFIFLVSEHSIAAKSYALTELGFAEKRWPDPNRNVLPVILDDTAIEKLPAYLRAVTISKPVGNVVAETVADVAALGRISRARWGQVGLVALLVLVSAGIAYLGLDSDTRGFDLEVKTITANERGFFDQGDSYELTGSINNLTQENEYLTALVAETRDPAIRAELTDYLGEQTELEIKREASASWSARISFEKANVGLSHEAVGDIQWRVCADLVANKVCSEYQKGSVDAVFQTPAPKTLEQSLGSRMRAVAATANGFAATLVQPNQLALLSADGSLVTAVDLVAEPVSLTTESDLIAVAMRFPDSVAITSIVSPRVEHQFPVPTLHVTTDGHTTDFSTRPNNVALLDGNVWLTVAGGEGENGLLLLPRGASDWRIHPAVDGFHIDPGDWVLHAGLDHIWAATADTTPHYLYRLDSSGLIEGSGHDNDDIQCASSLLPLGDAVGLLSCELELLRARVVDGKFKIQERLLQLKLPGYLEDSAQSYTEQLLVGHEGRIVVGVSARAVGNGEILGSAIYTNEQSLFKHRDYAIVSLASFENKVLAVLVNDKGRYVTLLF